MLPSLDGPCQTLDLTEMLLCCLQAANQATTEMKDKSKILTNELDILHSEVHVKDKLLGQSRSQHQVCIPIIRLVPLSAPPWVAVQFCVA